MIKIGAFFEEHIEKLILIIVGIVCVWLLITRVILSPNLISSDGRNFSPSAIDDHVYQQAELLSRKLNEPPEKLEPYKPKVSEFLALLESSINDINTELWPVVPYEADTEAGVAGVYRLPVIGEVNEVAVEHIRAVAYVPIDEVTEENPYDKVGNEPNDIDLVTVEANYNISGLFDGFKESFVEDVEEQWADPCLAKPIFAAVQLQRQELNGDGTWSDWQNVPRARIEQHAKLFEIIEDTKDLPFGGLKVQMLQFDNKLVQIDLLQPQAYQIASANEEWLPPVLHRKFKDFQRKEALEERREAKEAEKQEREKELEQKRSRRTTDTRSGAGGRGLGSSIYDTLGGTEGLYGSRDQRSRGRGRDRLGNRAGPLTEGGVSTDRRRPRGRTTEVPELYDGIIERPGESKRTPRRPSINDVYDEFDEILLTRMTDFEKIREPLLFWHHDDTVEPGKTYRYKIRLGVFNPVAGTNQLSEQDKSRKNEIILWSDFSDTTEPVEIPGRLYFFAKDIREMDKTVTVQVSKLALGRWYDHDFPVKPGEVIGDVIETEPEKPKRSSVGRFAAVIRPEEKSEIPEIIDYGTGAVMVDALPVNDWSGERNMRTRHYYDMLYSFDGTNIEHMPVSATYWDTDLQYIFSQIGKLQREPQEPFKPFDTARKRRPRELEYEGIEEYDELYYEETMMDQMGDRGGRY